MTSGRRGDFFNVRLLAGRPDSVRCREVGACRSQGCILGLVFISFIRCCGKVLTAGFPPEYKPNIRSEFLPFHPLVFFHLSEVESQWQQAAPPQQLLLGEPGAPRPGRISNPCSRSGADTPGPSPRRVQNTPKGRRPGGILIRCPTHLIWLLSMPKSSVSPPSPPPEG